MGEEVRFEKKKGEKKERKNRKNSEKGKVRKGRPFECRRALQALAKTSLEINHEGGSNQGLRWRDGHQEDLLFIKLSAFPELHVAAQLVQLNQNKGNVIKMLQALLWITQDVQER